MRKFLIPLLASIAFPTSVNAETWHLIITGIQGSLVSVTTSSLEECEQSGKKAANKKGWKGYKPIQIGYVCVKGK